EMRGVLCESRSLESYDQVRELCSTENGARNTVYAAVYRGKECVVKQFRVNSDSKQRARFLKETRHLMKVAHPHVAEVEAVFFSSDGVYAYMHMPYYSGGDL